MKLMHAAALATLLVAAPALAQPRDHQPPQGMMQGQGGTGPRMSGPIQVT